MTNAAPPTLRAALDIFNRSLLYVSLGSVIAAVGLVAAAFAALRRRFDPLLLWFSLFALLYGARLVARHLPVWELGGYPDAVGRLMLGLGYLVPVPAFLFFRILGIPHRFGRALFLVVIPILILLSLTTLVVGTRYLFANINNLVITFALALLAVDLLVYTDQSMERRWLRRGLLLFILCALYENLSFFLRLPDLTVEPFAFVVLLGTLGVVAARRTLAQEQQLTLLHKELQIAQDIQQSILPGAFPPSRHFQVGVCYRPMTAVAGDLYDYLVTGDDEAGLLIGDVSGHGVPAALIASMVKVAATLQRHTATEPAAVLTGINDALCGNTQQQFVTAAYLYLNASTRELRYAAAAHPAAMLLRNGRTLPLEENGLMLALFAGAAYTTKTVPLHAGDRIVLYTDGLHEAENGTGEAFGIERLETAALESRTLPASAAASAIVTAVERWSALQSDDLTIVVCDYLA